MDRPRGGSNARRENRGRRSGCGLFWSSRKTSRRIPWSAAIPHGFIKDRFDEELKDVLLRLRWWDKTGEELLEIIPLLCECDLEKAKTELKKFL